MIHWLARPEAPAARRPRWDRPLALFLPPSLERRRRGGAQHPCVLCASAWPQAPSIVAGERAGFC